MIVAVYTQLIFKAPHQVVHQTPIQAVMLAVVVVIIMKHYIVRLQKSLLRVYSFFQMSASKDEADLIT
jgi:hypothetical protein